MTVRHLTPFVISFTSGLEMAVAISKRLIIFKKFECIHLDLQTSDNPRRSDLLL